jgi:hypothetical protein
VAVGNSVLTIVWHLLADPRPATEISAPTSTPPRSTSMLLADLGVTKSHSRPHVPDDNPFSESQFKTLKHHPAFPDRFGSIQDARSFCQGFFRWYNHEHYHSGIALLTPADVHSGRAGQVTTAVPWCWTAPTPPAPSGSSASHPPAPATRAGVDQQAHRPNGGASAFSWLICLTEVDRLRRGL